MAEKLGIGDIMPDVEIDLVDGTRLSLPAGMEGRYKVILFYRGHWCLFCRRQLADFRDHKAGFDALGITIVAASADDREKAAGVADELNFAIGYGVTTRVADKLGSWWENGRGFIQPTELVLDVNNTVAASSYSAGPLGRMQASDVIALVKLYDARPEK